MRLGILSPAFPPFACSESEFVFRLAEGLAARGHSVKVFTPHPGDGRRPRFEVGECAGFFQTLNALLNQNADSLLVVYQPWLYKKQPGYERALKAFALLRPEVELELLYLNPAAGSGEWAPLMPYFSALHVLSERHRLALATRFPELKDRIYVGPIFSLAPNPDVNLSAPEAKAKLGLPPTDFLWVSLGYLFPGKGVELLLKAFARSLKTFPHSRLVVVGGRMTREYSAPGFAEWLTVVAESLGVADRVTWVSDFKGEAFPLRWVQAADAAALPHEMGLGRNSSAVATLCQFGLPLVAFRGDFLDPEFAPEHNCRLASQRSSLALAEAMEAVQGNEALRERLAQGARLLGKNVFAAEGALDHWSAILHRSMADSGVYLKDGETTAAPFQFGDLLPGIGGTPTPQN